MVMARLAMTGTRESKLILDSTEVIQRELGEFD